MGASAGSARGAAPRSGPGALARAPARRGSRTYSAEPVGSAPPPCWWRWFRFARSICRAASARLLHAFEHGAHSAGLSLRHGLEMGFQAAVLDSRSLRSRYRNRYCQISSNRVHGRTRRLPRCAHGVAGCSSSFSGSSWRSNRVDQLVFGRVVVVQVAGADAQLGRNGGGGHIGRRTGWNRSSVTSRMRSRAAWRFL